MPEVAPVINKTLSFKFIVIVSEFIQFFTSIFNNQLILETRR